tara:strand:+ start:396 stop:737 length:342 start_codon:yes stop_codon:yes gene_type:complete
MIKFLKVQNWKLMHSHNTHLILLLRGECAAKLYTHRQYRTCKVVEGVDGRDTLNRIQQKNFCGLKIVLQIGRRRVGVCFGGDSEYMRAPPARRSAVRVCSGYGKWVPIAMRGI